jgi:hypothetical protein
MNSTHLSVLLRHIRSLGADRTPDGPRDSELLERFRRQPR